jgi:hypothetical protein
MIAEWKKSGGTVSQNQNGDGLIELAFQGWPIGDDGKMIYWIDPETFAITGMEVSIDSNQVSMVAEGFLEVAGTLIPNEIRLKNLNFVGDQITKVTKWKFSEEGASTIDPSQTYLACYGLADPDLGVLPEQPKRWWLWVTISLCLIIATGLSWYLYRSDRFSLE